MHKVVVVGHVDHGKSTLLGQLLSETGHLKQDKIDRVTSICASKGIALEPAFFLDALEEEQAQGISIDTTCIKFEYKGEPFFLVDAPGHIDFLKNMASGASHADCGVLVIDVQEGIKSQTIRHLRILGILGVGRVIVALNKMDRVEYSQEAFEAIAEPTRRLIEAERIDCIEIIPMVAFSGENIVRSSNNMNWYTGKPLLELLLVQCSQKPDDSKVPFRMVLQDIYKFGDHRYFAGRVIAGSVKTGSEVCFSPSGKIGTIAAIDDFPQENLPTAESGASIGIRLAEQLFVERGEVLSLPHQLPHVDTHLKANIVWIASTAFDPNATYIIKIGTKQVSCKIEVQETVAGESTSDAEENSSKALIKGEFGDVVIKASSPVAYDRSRERDALNKLVICNEHETVAAGLIDISETQTFRTITINPNVHQEKGFVERDARETRQKHKGAVIWLTGLSGAGKSTLARALEHSLFNAGHNVNVIDADNMRLGLCADLGFSPEDRSENVRRLAHVAKLMMNTGSIVIVAVISPYERDRQMAASIIGHEYFSEVFVFCPLETCQERDPKGLYKRFAKGQVESFTGFDLPYQTPKNPDLRIDTSAMTVEEEIDKLIQLLVKKKVIAKN